MIRTLPALMAELFRTTLAAAAEEAEPLGGIDAVFSYIDRTHAATPGSVQELYTDDVQLSGAQYRKFQWYRVFKSMADELEKEFPAGWTMIPVPKQYQDMLESLHNIKALRFWADVKDGTEEATMPAVAQALELIRLILQPLAWIDIKTPPAILDHLHPAVGKRQAVWWRCWANGTWDEGIIELPRDVPDWAIETALKQAVSELTFPDELFHFGFSAWVADKSSTATAAA